MSNTSHTPPPLVDLPLISLRSRGADHGDHGDGGAVRGGGGRRVQVASPPERAGPHGQPALAHAEGLGGPAVWRRPGRGLLRHVLRARRQ
eukprot:1192931-Prorocentrum_minimum.AAC.12